MCPDQKDCISPPKGVQVAKLAFKPAIPMITTTLPAPTVITTISPGKSKRAAVGDEEGGTSAVVEVASTPTPTVPVTP